MNLLRRIGEWSFAVAALALIAQPLAAHAKAKSEENTVTFNAFDFGFKGPESIKGGVVKLQIKNEGEDIHHAQLIRLLDGKTADDFVTGLKVNSKGPMPGWVKFVGGPNAVVPGHYGLICFFPDEKGENHFKRGMALDFTVK